MANFPELGKPGNVSGTREFIPHGSYRLVYQIDEDAIWILALVHTSMMCPP
ncbi:type II toxin-antitoxin system RelE/ParE family toxin [Klebsiella pneumoniae]|uniref:type II toxin-antitoxin system RelE/ParE family toxin n=1 Tax=Klebsiella pneumoniae TaxID=573 RepID=UPI0039C9DA5D